MYSAGAFNTTEMPLYDADSRLPSGDRRPESEVPLNVIRTRSQSMVPSKFQTPLPNAARSTVPQKIVPATLTFAEVPSGPVQSPVRSGGQSWTEIRRRFSGNASVVSVDVWLATTMQLPAEVKNRTPPSNEQPGTARLVESDLDGQVVRRRGRRRELLADVAHLWSVGDDARRRLRRRRGGRAEKASRPTMIGVAVTRRRVRRSSHSESPRSSLRGT